MYLAEAVHTITLIRDIGGTDGEGSLILFINLSILIYPPNKVEWVPSFYTGEIGCGAAEATGLGFVCSVVINSRVLLANRVDLGFFVFVSYIFQFFPPPPQASCIDSQQIYY